MKIKIKLKNNTILEQSFEETLNTVEMPYMCVGYGFNGSSLASEEDLNEYWKVVDKILLLNNIDKEEYETLVSLDQQ